MSLFSKHLVRIKVPASLGNCNIFIFLGSRTGVFSNNPTKIRFIACKGGGFHGRDVSFSPIWVSSACRHQDWATQSWCLLMRTKDRRRLMVLMGLMKFDNEFDPGAPVPFRLVDVRAAIPKHCWVKDPWQSMSFVVRDVAVVFGLAAAATYINN
uniref:Fatty acid desaturase N-terminal domain-containing protein n=1 Tax=Nelumbo nucifera TaxID=4432 RepID=A0A822XE85_NELNU|nr:TPA_asm: hypothetical protein HUJ06_019960 [Nelumbo nucifera]DAD18498.1 TPA_asm: hypothetical protein HUJ06_019961 [Nelumbo nucifera]